MLHSDERRGSLFDGCYSGHRERLASVRALGAMVAALLLLPVLFFGGEYVQRYVNYHRARAEAPAAPPVSLTTPFRHIALNTVYEIPILRHQHKLLEAGLPVYDLRIGSKSLNTLHDTAELVTAREYSTGVQRDYVPAEFWTDGEWLPIEVRLRGFTSYHYLKKHLSLRLKFPKHRPRDGRRWINLIEPYDKELTADLTTNWIMRQHGVLTLDSRFVVLRMNGDIVGLFQEIEHFGPAIADRNGRPEGYIYSGEGELFGKEGAAFDKATSAIELVKRCHAMNGSSAAPHCTSWSFIQDYFDTDRLAWSAALTALLKSRHGWAPVNLRLFWDPSRGKFEPIPWDYLFFQLNRIEDPEGEADYSGYIVEPFLRVAEFRRMRDERIWQMLTRDADLMIDYADQMFEQLREALRHDVRHLSLEADIDQQRAFVNGLDANRDFLQELFQKHELQVRFWPGDDGMATLEILNFGKAHVEATAFRLERESQMREQELPAVVAVDGFWQGAPGRTVVRIPNPGPKALAGIVARNAITGGELGKDDITIQFMDGPAPEPTRSEVRSSDFVIALDNVHQKRGAVSFGPGRVTIESVLEIPSSHNVVFEPGLDLRFAEGASILIYGDLTAVGTAESPITIAGRDGVETWGALIVQGTRTRPSEVHIEHVIVDGGTGGQNERTWFTGPFAVHDGTVIIKSSQFRNGVTDDAINLKNCQVQLEDNLFLGSFDDAVDCDFCVGELVGNSVIDVAGDAFDFSGSEVLLTSNVVESCGDKGVSVGEHTKVVIDGNRIDQCKTGIAVKDLSEAAIRNNRLSRLRIGIAAYVKKLTFGASTASVERTQLIDTETPFLREDRCTIATRDDMEARQTMLQ